MTPRRCPDLLGQARSRRTIRLAELPRESEKVGIWRYPFLRHFVLGVLGLLRLRFLLGL